MAQAGPKDHPDTAVGQLHQLGFAETLGPIRVSRRGPEQLIQPPRLSAVLTGQGADQLGSGPFAAHQEVNADQQPILPGHHDPIARRGPQQRFAPIYLNVIGPLQQRVPAGPGPALVLRAPDAQVAAAEEELRAGPGHRLNAAFWPGADLGPRAPGAALIVAGNGRARRTARADQDQLAAGAAVEVELVLVDVHHLHVELKHRPDWLSVDRARVRRPAVLRVAGFGPHGEPPVARMMPARYPMAKACPWNCGGSSLTVRGRWATARKVSNPTSSKVRAIWA